MKKRFLAMLCAVVFCMTVLPVTSHATESDLAVDGAPVYGPYIEDPALSAKAAQKEAFARSGARSIAADANYSLGILQIPQETNTWCGFAAMESVLEYKGFSVTQTQLKQTNGSNSLAWYTIDGSQVSQFPAVNMLNSYTGANWSYVPYPLGQAGARNLSTSELSPLITNTVYNGYGVLAAGISQYGYTSHLPNYPSYNVNHWVVVRGYLSGGQNYYIADPAKSDSVSWSGSVSAYYTITDDCLAAFASHRGIVY